MFPEYVEEIYQVIVKLIDSNCLNKAAPELEALAPPPVNRMMDRQDREEAIQRHIARKEMVIEVAPPTNPGLHYFPFLPFTIPKHSCTQT